MVHCVQIPRRKDSFDLHPRWARHCVHIRLAAGILANILHTFHSQFLLLTQPSVNTFGTSVVNIANCISNPLPLSMGVPQGSILAPVLFTLYVNDLLSVPKHCQAMGYVDDTKIFLDLPPSQISDAVTALKKDLSDIARWCCMNSLLINPDKTKLLVIGVPQLMRIAINSAS